MLDQVLSDDLQVLASVVEHRLPHFLDNSGFKATVVPNILANSLVAVLFRNIRSLLQIDYQLYIFADQFVQSFVLQRVESGALVHIEQLEVTRVN